VTDSFSFHFKGGDWNMNPSADQLTRKIVPFGPSAGDKQSDELDRSGEAIISLLQQAADAARANEDRAANTTLAV
jgi:hypothetical protein